MFLNPQLLQHTLPGRVGVPFELFVGPSETDQLAFEIPGAVFGSVVDEVVSDEQVFAVGEKHALFEEVIKMPLYPQALVHGRLGVAPGGRGGDKQVVPVVLGQLLYGIDGSVNRIGIFEDPGDLVGPVLVGPVNFGVVVEEPLLGLSEVYQDPVHVDVDDFFVHSSLYLICLGRCIRFESHFSPSRNSHFEGVDHLFATIIEFSHFGDQLHGSGFPFCSGSARRFYLLH